MNHAAQAYADKVFPAHQIRPIRSVAHSRSGGHTVIASYRSVADAATAAARLPTHEDWSEIEVMELVGPGSLASAPDAEGPAGLSIERVGAGLLIGIALGALLFGSVFLLAGASTVIVVGGLVAGAGLGGVIGLALGGAARYGGEHGVAQASVPNRASVAVMTVWTRDRSSAAVVAHSLGATNQIDLEVVDGEGRWYAPGGD